MLLKSFLMMELKRFLIDGTKKILQWLHWKVLKGSLMMELKTF